MQWKLVTPSGILYHLGSLLDKETSSTYMTALKKYLLFLLRVTWSTLCQNKITNLDAYRTCANSSFLIKIFLSPTGQSEVVTRTPQENYEVFSQKSASEKDEFFVRLLTRLHFRIAAAFSITMSHYQLQNETTAAALTSGHRESRVREPISQVRRNAEN